MEELEKGLRDTKRTGLKDDRDSTGRPTESTNLDSWGLSETKPRTKEGEQA